MQGLGVGTHVFNRFFTLGLLRGGLASPLLSARFVPRAVAAAAPAFLPLPLLSAAAGVEAASEALSKDEAWIPASPLVDDGGDEASLTLVSFSSAAGLSLGKRLSNFDDSLRTMVRLGVFVVAFLGDDEGMLFVTMYEVGTAVTK